MILNAGEIESTIASLKDILAEQERILKETEQIVLNDLTFAWECNAQRAYADAFIGIRDNMLTQINGLIDLFGTAFKESQDGLYQVDVDISTMNATALTGE